MGTAKALALYDAGAVVRVIARQASERLRAAAWASKRLTVETRDYSGPEDIAAAELVVAATGSPADERIAEDARTLHRVVVVAGNPPLGNATSMAVHRAGPLAIGVSAGGVPGAAARIRDALAKRFDSRYADALTSYVALRSKTITESGSSTWASLNSKLATDDFCDAVENGEFARALAKCR